MFIGRQLVRHIPWSGNISQSNKWENYKKYEDKDAINKPRLCC